MDSEIGIVEQRLKSFAGQFQTECGILDRLVYKHKNQHRRSSYFQYILKVRRDLKLLQSANLEEVLDSSFLVINGNRPKQKVQLLESVKRRRCSGGKYNFLERLLGVTRLLSQIVEPLLKASMEISTLLARSFFMKFSLTILAVLARVRVLVQQMLLDSVVLYNTVSSLSRTEQTVKLNQEGFEVFREYYPKKEENAIMLECIWQIDKYVLVEKICKSEIDSKDKEEDVLLNTSNIRYENIEVLLGADESGTIATQPISGDQNIVKKTGNESGLNNDLNHDGDASATNIVPLEENIVVQDGLCLTQTLNQVEVRPPSSSCAQLVKPNKSEMKKVAFVSVKPPAASTAKKSSEVNKEDSFFDLLTGGSKNDSPL